MTETDQKQRPVKLAQVAKDVGMVTDFSETLKIRKGLKP